jgi:hypothetical protein
MDPSPPSGTLPLHQKGLLKFLFLGSAPGGINEKKSFSKDFFFICFVFFCTKQSRVAAQEGGLTRPSPTCGVGLII